MGITGLRDGYKYVGFVMDKLAVEENGSDWPIYRGARGMKGRSN